MTHAPFTEPDDDMMGEINMVPFIDIMLVLLIVFIITVPVMQHAVNVQLPRAVAEQEVVEPQTLRLSVDAGGTAEGVTNAAAAKPSATSSLPSASRRKPRASHNPPCTSAATATCATSASCKPCPPRSKPASRASVLSPTPANLSNNTPPHTTGEAPHAQHP